MREVNIGAASEFADPGRKIVGFEHFEVAVFKLDGEFYAYLNHCPHMGGPACQGKMIAKVEEIIAEDRTSKGMTFSKSKLHVVCPWHGFEFDIRTGVHTRESEGAPAQGQGRGDRRRRGHYRAGGAGGGGRGGSHGRNHKLGVVVRLDRTTQYAAAYRLKHHSLWNTGCPGQAGA